MTNEQVRAHVAINGGSYWFLWRNLNLPYPERPEVAEARERVIWTIASGQSISWEAWIEAYPNAGWSGPIPLPEIRPDH